MKKISVLILTGLLSLSVFAQSDWYGGIGVVKSSGDESISGINYDLKYDKANVKVFTGVKLENNFAVEFQYVNFAKDDIGSVSGVSKIDIGSISAGTDITISAIETEGSSFGGALLYNFTPESDISAFVKVGIHAWNTDINASVTSATDTETLSISDDGTDLFYGVGVDIKTTDSITTRIDYERFEFDDVDIDNFGVSVVFSF